jgi:small multidrug resistance family-3 protein
MNAFLCTFVLFSVTAAAEIFGCYSVYLWLKMHRTPLWLLLAALSLALFAWLLSLHQTTAAGRTYAAYGGIYIAASLVWLWRVEGQSPDRWDPLGSLVCILGAAIILYPHFKP